WRRQLSGRGGIDALFSRRTFFRSAVADLHADLPRFEPELSHRVRGALQKVVKRALDGFSVDFIAMEARLAPDRAGNLAPRDGLSVFASAAVVEEESGNAQHSPEGLPREEAHFPDGMHVELREEPFGGGAHSRKMARGEIAEEALFLRGKNAPEAIGLRALGG